MRWILLQFVGGDESETVAEEIEYTSLIVGGAALVIAFFGGVWMGGVGIRRGYTVMHHNRLRRPGYGAISFEVRQTTMCRVRARAMTHHAFPFHFQPADTSGRRGHRSRNEQDRGNKGHVERSEKTGQGSTALTRQGSFGVVQADIY